MRLTMRERKAVTGVLVERYRRAGKKAKGRMLDELIKLTGYSSAATIDRLLAPERKRLRLRGRSGIKPGTLLKHQVPIRTFSEWDEQKPGFVEIDLVAHGGGYASGDYAQTLNATDVDTGWTEPQAIQNKVQVGTFEALKAIRHRLPFPLLGIDSDNGGEFINHHLLRYCQDGHITFICSRLADRRASLVIPSPAHFPLLYRSPQNHAECRSHMAFARFPLRRGRSPSPARTAPPSGHGAGHRRRCHLMRDAELQGYG